MNLTKSKKPAIDHIDGHLLVVEPLAKLNKLIAYRDGLRQREQAISLARTDTQHEADRQRMVAALAEHGAMPERVGIPSAVELSKIVNERRIYDEAIEQARKEVQNARCAASRELAATIRQNYTAIVQRTAAALDQLKAALLEESRLRAAVNNAGYSTFEGSMVAMPFMAISEGDYTDSIDAWRSEAKRNGYL